MKRSSQILIVFWVLSASSLFVSRSIIGHWVDYMWLPLVGSLITPFLVLAIDFKFIKEAISSYRMRLLGLVIQRGVLLTIVLLLLGSFVFSLNLVFDLSHSKVNSLSPESVKALEQVKQPVVLKGFFQKRHAIENIENFRMLMKELQANSKEFSYEILDADLNPSLVEKYKITKTPSFVLESGERLGVLNSWSEEKIINEIIRLQRSRDRVVCSLTGNGEIAFDSKDTYRLKLWAEQIADLGYELRAVSELDFIRSFESCDLVAIISPKQKYSELLIQRLEEYVLKSGSLVVALDPEKKHGLGPFLKRFGIQFFNNYIIDPSGTSAGFNAATVVASDWNLSIDLGDWLKSYAVVFPVASKIDVIKAVQKGFDASALVSSVKSSFVRSQLSEKIQLKPGVDEQGPFAVGALSTNGESKLLVFGDADFLTDDFFVFQGNRQLTIQMLNFLDEGDGLIKLAPKSFFKQIFIITPVKAKLFLIFGVFPIPFLLFGLSIWTFIRRRGTS